MRCISTVMKVSGFFSIPFLKYLLIHLLGWILMNIKLMFSQSCYKVRYFLLVPMFNLKTILVNVFKKILNFLQMKNFSIDLAFTLPLLWWLLNRGKHKAMHEFLYTGFSLRVHWWDIFFRRVQVIYRQG